MWKILAAIMVLGTVAVGLTAIIIQSPAPDISSTEAKPKYGIFRR